MKTEKIAWLDCVQNQIQHRWTKVRPRF